MPNQQVINQLTENNIIQRPVFEKFGEKTEQMHNLGPMKIADERLRAYFLGHSVPATSFATGRNATGAEVIKEERDYKDYKSGDWPRWFERWRHSDIKNVAYYYVSKFYESIVNGEK